MAPLKAAVVVAIATVTTMLLGATTADGAAKYPSVENILVDVNAGIGEWCCAAVLQDPHFGVASRTTTGLWPRECAWMEVLFDVENQDLEENRDAQVLSQALPGVCEAWMALKQPGEDRLVKGRLRLPTQVKFNHRYGAHHDAFYRGVVETTIAELPGEQMRFSQLATLSMAMTECNTIHHKEMHPSNWAPFCGFEEYRARGGSCDCDAILVAFTRRWFIPRSDDDGDGDGKGTAGGGGGKRKGCWFRFGGGGGGTGIGGGTGTETAGETAGVTMSMRADTSPPSEVVRRLFEPGGFVHDPNTVKHHLPVLRERGEGKAAAWSRFLMYLPLHDEEEADVDRQVAFGV